MRQFLFTCLWIGIIVVAGGCRPQLQGAAARYYQSLSADDQYLVRGWKDDPLGCNLYRDADKADRVLHMVHGAQLSEDVVVALLGPADESKQTQGIDYLGYIWDGTCDGHKLKPGSVFCVLQCYFDAATKAWKMGSVVCG
jgi:hypothetical protein